MAQETTSIKVIVVKSKRNKALIGFSSTPILFVTDWVSKRSQFTQLTEVSPTHYTVLHEDNPEDVYHFYVTSIRDNETCYVSLNNNCMGFNDNH